MSTIKIGNVEVKSGDAYTYYNNPYNLDCVIHNSSGKNWYLPLGNITPEDLRDLANLMEEKLMDGEKGKQKVITHCMEEDKQLFYTSVAKGVEAKTIQFNFNFENQANDFKKLDLPPKMLKKLLDNSFACEEVHEMFSDKTTVTLHFV